MNHSRIMSRLTGLEARQHPAIPQDLIERLAEACGATVAELLAEAEMIARRCRQAGAITHAAQLQFLADDCGIAVADLEAELAGLGIPHP